MQTKKLLPSWNFANVWEVVSERLPEVPALVHGDHKITWIDFNRRANSIAHYLVRAGLGHQAKVAQYLHNSPEFLESVFATWKAGMVPVNTNYRYIDDELVYLWTNADVEAVVFHGVFTAVIERLRERVPAVRSWLWVDDQTGPEPSWADSYGAVASKNLPRCQAPWGRSGDDLYLLYTGGTTGRPKGVMWRQDDFFRVLNATAKVRYPEDASLSEVAAMLTKPGPIALPSCPLMHATGAGFAFAALSSGGTVVTSPQRKFSADRLLDLIAWEKVQSLAIVGDAFARPLVDELDKHPSRWDISSLRVIVSSGAIWSPGTKARLLAHNSKLTLVDSLGSSEAVGVGVAVSKSGEEIGSTSTFALSQNTKVITDDGRFVVPGSGEIGLMAFGGPAPLGYYKDEEKTRATFRVVDGQRFAVPGDFALLEADGTVRLLGRGSSCINTAGEKVFAEEIEELLKQVADVTDAVVVGVADERLGQAVAAIIEAPSTIDVDGVLRHVRTHAAAYKTPRRVVIVDSIGRSPNGKVDYPRWRSFAEKARLAERER